MDIYFAKSGNYEIEALNLGIIKNASENWESIQWREYTKTLFKIYAKQIFDEKWYDQESYDEFSDILTNMIWIEDDAVSYEDFEELKKYLQTNNDLFKKRVENIFVYQDAIIDFMQSWKSDEKKKALGNIISNYFNIVNE
jgi:hypothetical protein